MWTLGATVKPGLDCCECDECCVLLRLLSLRSTVSTVTIVATVQDSLEPCSYQWARSEARSQNSRGSPSRRDDRQCYLTVERNSTAVTQLTLDFNNHNELVFDSDASHSQQLTLTMTAETFMTGGHTVDTWVVVGVNIQVL